MAWRHVSGPPSLFLWLIVVPGSKENHGRFSTTLPLSLSLSLFRLGLESFLIGFGHGFDLYGTKDNFEHDMIASLEDRVSAEGVASLGNLGQWRGSASTHRADSHCDRDGYERALHRLRLLRLRERPLRQGVVMPCSLRALV